MILKSLTMRNIRSYTGPVSIDFTKGKSLFFGDVGSGKSSILYAVEFALFGLTGDIEGQAILRTGCSEGEVELTFEEGGREYKIYRKITQKGKGYSQVKGTLSWNGESHSYNPEEMREKILEILKFREKPNPRASSVIYRYGIFTPQEQTKEILMEKPETRLETLRRAFGLEKYSLVAANAENLQKLINEIKISLENEAKDLGEIRGRLAEFNIKIAAKTGEMKELKAEISILETKIEDLKNEERKLSEKLGEVRRIEGEVSQLKDAVKGMDEQIKDLEGEIKKLEGKKGELEKRKALLSITKPTGRSEEDIQSELNTLREEKGALQKELGGLEEKLRNYENILEKGICPTCDRELDDPSQFKEKYKSWKTKYEEKKVQSKELDRELQGKDSLLKNLKNYIEVQEKLKQIEKDLQENGDFLAKKKKLKKDLENEYAKKSNTLLEKQKYLNENRELTRKLEELGKKIKTLDGQKREKEVKGAGVDRDLIWLEKQKGELEGEIKKKFDSEKKAKVYGEVARYLKEFFTPTVKRIETIVLQKIQEEFDRHFQRYFSMIIGSTEIEAWIGEDFSPVIRQDEYEIQFRNLSGGEKTSLALAYRLALNLTVKKLSSLEKTLLILDEPTDGFSREQVWNLREVLEDLDCDQIIIISHEEETKGFMDKVYQVTKSNHVSLIERCQA